jgi:hypothetical protein
MLSGLRVDEWRCAKTSTISSRVEQDCAYTSPECYEAALVRSSRGSTAFREPLTGDLPRTPTFLVLRWIEAREARSRLGSSPWPLRHGGRPSPSATGAVGLPGGGDPILLVYRPAAICLLHARLGDVHPTKPIGLADIHPWFHPWPTFSLIMIAILPRLARADTEMPRQSLTRRMIVHSPSAMDFREHVF